MQKKGTVLLSTSLAWPAVAGCSRAEAFSQLSSNKFTPLCTATLYFDTSHRSENVCSTYPKYEASCHAQRRFAILSFGVSQILCTFQHLCPTTFTSVAFCCRLAVAQLGLVLLPSSFSGKIAPRSKSADFAAREPPEAPSDILPPPVAKIEEVAAAIGRS